MLFLPAAILYRDWKYHDKRTKRHYQITRGITVAWLLTGVLLTGLVWYEEYQDYDLINALKTVNAKNDSLLYQNNQLLSQNIRHSAQIEAYKEDLEREKQTVEALKQYADIAPLNFIGIKGIYGKGLKESSAYSRILESAVEVVNDKYTPKCDAGSIQQFQELINKHPRFPFGYFCMAQCLAAQGKESWKDYASQGIEILEKTTLLAGHHPHQKKALQTLRRVLRQDSLNYSSKR